MVIGNINSAAERPNQVALRALPLFKLKYLEILVVAVCYTVAVEMRISTGLMLMGTIELMQ